MNYRFLLIPFMIIGLADLPVEPVSPGPNLSTVASMEEYAANLLAFKKAVHNWHEATGSELTPSETVLHLTGARMAYKKVEFILNYQVTTFDYHFFNGPPLIKSNKDDEGGPSIPPNGLQTLDELIYSDEAEANMVEVQRLVSQLNTAIDELYAYYLPVSITPAELIEAIRAGLIRVYTLGLTGFDTPGSGRGLEEAEVSIMAMTHAFEKMGRGLNGEERTGHLALVSMFEQLTYALGAASDFEQLDRLALLTDHINPLYKALLNFARSMGLPAGTIKYQAVNFESDNLFSRDFLDLNYFSRNSFLPLDNEAAVQLGKVLFNDVILSKNLDLSCASCHRPELAFADGLKTSVTNSAHETMNKRNTPGLINAGYANRQFWDMRTYSLERQIAHVVEDSLEFNLDFSAIAERLKQSRAYREAFQSIYGASSRDPIHARSISHAVAAYVHSLASFESPFDRYVRGEQSNLDASVVRGFNLFMGKAACGTCHFPPIFNGNVPPFYIETESEVLGVTTVFDTIAPVLDNDIGRMGNGLKRDRRAHFLRSMKTPTVRNVERTGPYMHNGSLNSLEEVLHFYNKGGGAGMGLDVPFQTLSDEALDLTEGEMQDLIAFMHSLTDTTLMKKTAVELPHFENHLVWNKRKQ